MTDDPRAAADQISKERREKHRLAAAAYRKRNRDRLNAEAALRRKAKQDLRGPKTEDEKERHRIAAAKYRHKNRDRLRKTAATWRRSRDPKLPIVDEDASITPEGPAEVTEKGTDEQFGSGRSTECQRTGRDGQVGEDEWEYYQARWVRYLASQTEEDRRFLKASLTREEQFQWSRDLVGSW
ncbi:hypothetical protein BD779DRAFT_1673574 [Infundibulicybe gibba]|nr:hypothetical protein BD779DRAFT_1673574 [Infundibulicybe gibba]